MRLLLSTFFLCWCLTASAGSTEYARHIADLITPTKLATLGSRGANPRVQKAVAQLEAAGNDGLKVKSVLSDAVAIAGYTNPAAAKLTREAMVRNFEIARRLGCLDADGLAEMRRGKSPTIKKGPYKGQQLSDEIQSKSESGRKGSSSAFPSSARLEESAGGSGRARLAPVLTGGPKRATASKQADRSEVPSCE